MIRESILRWQSSYSAVPLLLFIAIAVFFTIASPNFLTVENLMNILVQASSVAVVAVGMTFVLLTAGIDLSVGSVMFLCSAVGGTLAVHGDWPVVPVIFLMLGCGLLCGCLNGFFVARVSMVPFIVTLAMLFVARGTGLWITETRALNLPDDFRLLATTRILGFPTPVLVLFVVCLTGHLILTRTPFGRQLYAVGFSQDTSRRAGINVPRVLFTAYLISGFCAALGGLIILAQLASVSPNLGQGRELDVIAAAVLGGTSLFGGRGSVPGSVLGAVLVESVRNGMNILDANPYVYPVIIGAIIFIAVLLDSLRNRQIARSRRRKIRVGGE